MGNIMEKLELTAQSMYCKKIEELTPAELHYSLGKAVMGEIAGNWEASKIKHDSERRAYYFSAEFLMGRMMYNNLYCLGILEDVTKLLKKKGIDINVFVFASLQEPQILYISIRLLPDRTVPNYYHLLFLRTYSF